jgi:IclR family KDG regulon transcriptional repressor
MAQTVRSVERALDIVESLAESPGSRSLSHLSRELDLPLSTCHILLQTLVRRGYLLRDPQQNTYRLSSKWANLRAGGSDEQHLREQADQVMNTIYSLCGESLTLAVMDGDDMLVVHNKISRRPLVLVNRIGARLPVHTTAMGKAIMAHWSEKEVDSWLAHRVLARYATNTITSASQMKACLDEVRKSGIAYAHEEYAEGVFAIGACILGNRNEPIGALSVLVPKPAVSDTDFWHCLSKLVRAGADTISGLMGSSAIQGATGIEALRRMWEDCQQMLPPPALC